MKPWNKVIIILSAISVLAIACIISWMYGFRNGMRAGGFVSSIAELMSANQHLADQMTNANCDGVKQAINDYLKINEKYKDVKNGFITETSYYSDKMLGHVRLARIEDNQGNQAEKIRHIAIAREACIALKWQDCSDEKLMNYEIRLDEKNPIACLSNKEIGHAQPSR